MHLSWKVDGDVLYFHWHEAGAPRVEEPTRAGFGSRLIAMGLGHGSSVERRYKQDGFKLDITVPVTSLAH